MHRIRVALLLLVPALAVALGTAATAWADLFDDLTKETTTAEQVRTFEGNGSAGISYYGTGLTLPLPPGGGGGTVLSSSLNTGQGCGAFNFVNEFKAIFDANALESYFKSLGSAILASAPLVLLCYASPTLCDVYKHLKALSSTILQTRAGECQAIERAAENWADKQVASAQSQCVSQAMADGLDFQTALDKCKQESGSTVLNYLRVPVKNIDFVKDGLEKVGASPETTALAKSVLGSVVFTSSGTGGTRTYTPAAPDAPEKLWRSAYKDTSDCIQDLVDKAGHGTTLSANNVQCASVPGLPTTPVFLQNIALLPDAQRAIAIQKLSAAVTLAKLEHMISVMELKLKDKERLAAMSAQDQEDTRNAIEEARAVRDRLRTLKASQEDLNRVKAEILAASQANQARRDAETPPVGQQPQEPSTASGTPILGGGLTLE